MTDTEKQFAGNYVRLVNKSRSLEQDVMFKNKIIELMAQAILLEYPAYKNIETIITEYENDVLCVIVAEQNKKAADNASI